MREGREGKGRVEVVGLYSVIRGGMGGWIFDFFLLNPWYDFRYMTSTS